MSATNTQETNGYYNKSWVNTRFPAGGGGGGGGGGMYADLMFSSGLHRLSYIGALSGHNNRPMQIHSSAKASNYERVYYVNT